MQLTLARRVTRPMAFHLRCEMYASVDCVPINQQSRRAGLPGLRMRPQGDADRTYKTSGVSSLRFQMIVPLWMTAFLGTTTILSRTKKLSPSKCSWPRELMIITLSPMRAFLSMMALTIAA